MVLARIAFLFFGWIRRRSPTPIGGGCAHVDSEDSGSRESSLRDSDRADAGSRDADRQRAPSATLRCGFLSGRLGVVPH